MNEVTKIKTIDEIRAEMDEPPLPDGQGEIILDPTFLQNIQGQQMAEEGGDEDGFGGGGDWFGGDKDGDKDGDKESGDNEDKGSKSKGNDEDKSGDKNKGKNEMPAGIKDGNKTKGGQKEAFAASMAVLRDIEVLRKSERVHNGIQTIDVEIVGE